MKIFKRSGRKTLGMNATSAGALLMIAAFAPATHTAAGTWNAVGSNNWNDYFNWSDFIVPNSPTATATFGNLSTELSPTLSAAVEVASITFTPDANAYMIDTDGNTLTIVGAGIINNSGNTQTILNDNLGTITFNNASTAGNAVIDNASGSSITFTNTSTAGSATIDSNGSITFNNTSTAGSATITNEGESPDLSNGVTNFNDSSTAGKAVITNDGGTTGPFSSGSGGTTIFNNTSTAGNAMITNKGGTNTGSSGGTTVFNNTSTAGNATINNNAGTVVNSDGFTDFFNNSNASKATLNNNGGTVGDSGGRTGFYDSSTAGSATINNNGGTVVNSGGVTDFLNSSTAGSAAINNKGGTVVGGSGGVTQFFNNSTAGNATIITNGGTGGGSGGTTFFLDSSDGGTARAITNGNGSFDISGLTSSGMRIGSIEGSGNYFLGSKTLTVGDNDLSTTVSGVIQDGGFFEGTRGSLTKVGTGMLTLSGTNTYTGGTHLNGGTVAVNTDANLGTGPLSFNGGTLEALSAGGGIISSKVITLNSGGGTFSADTDTNSTLSGQIGGPGAFTKSGLGTLILTAANTYSGQTTVDNGNLIINGSIASTQVVVNPGGLLGGTGLIGANVVNNGIISPGNPTGTLTISGNYTQTSNGTLRILVGGTAPGQFGMLVVSGHASLGGTLQLVSLNNFNFQVGNKISFLTADGGVSGSFSSIQNPFISNTLVKAEVVVLPDAIEIEGTQGLLTNIPGVILSPNELAVAKALDSAAGDPRAAALFAFLNSQPLGNLPHDLSLIAPTQISSMNATTVSLGKIQASNIGSRLLNVRGGSTGFSSSGFGISGGSANFDTGLAGPSGDEGKAGPPVFAPTPENRWGVFVTGTGEFTNVDSTPNAAGYNVNTGGITVGVDYRLTPNFVIGLDGSYAHTNVNLDGGGNVTVNAGTVGLYATVFADGFYLDLAGSGGPNGYDTNRTALQGSASGSTEGANANVLVAGGYDWKRGGFSIGPTATFEFSYVSIDGFTETGSLAPLKLRDQSYESERTIFGAKAAYNWKIGSITLIPQVSVGWVHEYGSVAYSVIANFANGAGNSFTVNGPAIGRDGVLVTAGMSMIWTDRISTYIYYDGELARTNYDSHTVVGGVRISF